MRPDSKKPECSKYSGFTLIEVLLSLLIVVLLVAVLLPVVYLAREKGRQSACLSNLRQIGIAFKAYAEDNDGTYPSPGRWVQWRSKGVSDLHCPSVKVPEDRRERDRLGNVAGYAVNIHILASDFEPTEQGAETRIKYPATTVALFDTTLGADLLLAPDPCLYIAPCSYAGHPKGYQRHSGGGNYAFCDGHARWYRPEEVRGAFATDPTDTFNGFNDGKTPSFAIEPGAPTPP
jgi:Type II secretory pathway, pseudopilin PulG